MLNKFKKSKSYWFYLKMNLENNLHAERRSFPVRAMNYVVETVKSGAYQVDTGSSIGFFQPLLTLNEICLNGYSLSESLANRPGGIALSLVSSRFFCKLRDKWKKKVWKINENSSRIRGYASDLSFSAMVTPVMYGITLGIGSIFGDKSFVEQLQATWKGTLVVLGGIPAFGKYYLDRNRRMFGTTPLDQEFRR